MTRTASAKPLASPASVRSASPGSRLRFAGPFTVSFVDDLHSSTRKLYAGGVVGAAVHAASFMRERRIVLDAVLLKQPRELRRIVTHELFHFAWIRLGNPRRRQWQTLLAAEIKNRARGELGWSAEWRKRELAAIDLRLRNRRWRDYTCESFCDTAAWLFSGARPHPEATLSARQRARRVEWFVGIFQSTGVTI